MTVPELMSDAQTGVGTPAEQREMSPCAAEEGGEGGAGEGVAAAPAAVPGEPGLGAASGPHGSNGNGQESDAGRHTSDAGVPTPVEGQSEGAGDVGKGAGVPPVADQPGGDYPAEEQPPPVAPASVAVPASGACSTAKPPVAPASAMSPRVGVVPPKYADGKAVVSKYSLPRHSNGAKALSLQAALGATPNHQALLDSPVLLPMVAAEPSPTTGTVPPLFQNTAVPMIVGGDSVDKKWRVNPSTLGQDSKQPQPRASGSSPRPTDDGYHWRKYGEKMVKGSPYPRSYYKCTHPGCPVRKVVTKDRETGATKDKLYKGTHTHRAPAPNKVPGNGKAAASGPAAAVLAKQSANVMSAMSSAKEEGDKQEAEASGSQQALENLRREGSNLAFTSPKSPVVPRLDVLSALPLGAAPSGERSAASTPGANPLLPVEPLSRGASSALDTSSAPPTPMGTPSKAGRPLSMPDAIPLQPGLSPPPAPVPFPDNGTAAVLRSAVEEAEKMHGSKGAEAGSAHQTPSNSLKRPAGESLMPPERQASGSSKKRKSLTGSGAARADAGEEDDAAEAPERFSALPGRLVDMHENGDAKLVMWIQTDMDILEDGYRWRKYGQKIVRNNPFPRSYYKCTHSGCLVRKHLERSGKDKSCVVVTYEGCHSHEMPAPGSAPGAKKSARRDSSARKSTRTALLEEAAALEAAAENEAAAALTIISSPQTPRVQKKAGGSGSLPMMNLANYEMNNFTEESAATVLSTLEGSTPTPSKKALNLDLNFGMKSTAKKPTSAMGLQGPSNGSTPWQEPADRPAWDTTGYLATPKSPANTMLQSPPSKLRPPPGLDLPATAVPKMMPLEK
eukprot:jgi/Tetstr1/455436/TSEL_042265.t1